MLKKCVIVFLLLVVANLVNGQNNSSIDSLKNVVNNTATRDTAQVNAYMLLVQLLAPIDLDSSAHYAKKAVVTSLANKNYRLVKAYSNLGLINFYNSKSDSARYYYDKALLLLDVEDNVVERSTIYSNYSLSYQNSADFEKRIDYSLKAIDLVKDDPIELCLLYYNHSIILNEGGFTDRAKKYLELALEASKTAKDYRVEAATVRELAIYSKEEGNIEKAETYLKRGLELCEQLQSPETCFQIHSELGRLYTGQQLYKKAEKSLLKAKEYADQRKRPYEIMSSILSLGQYELSVGDFAKSSQYFREFNRLYQNNPEPQLIEAFKSWADAETKRGNYKKSNELLNKYLILLDTIYSEKNRAIIADVQTKYETEKKNSEIIAQQLKIEQSNNELQRKKSQNNYMIGIIVFLGLLSLLSWVLFKNWKKNKNQEVKNLKREYQISTLESLIQGEEKERFRIAKELHDGVNGDLSAIKYKLSSLLETNNKVINEAITMIDNSCKQVRAISHNLVPPALEDFNLIQVIEEYCNTMDAAYPQKIIFQQLGDDIVLSKNAEINIFRIIQELITNSIKHANATEINVQISHREHMLQVTIEDNGTGYDTNEAKNKGIGLKNIQSRLDYLNASIDVMSNEQGTSSILEISTKNTYDN